MDRLEQFALLNKFAVMTDNSVRIFTKRDLSRRGFKPPKGSQVFVGRLPADAYEDEIYAFFSAVGEIYQIKLILKLNGETKGFCFVTYLSAKLADNAVTVLNGQPIRPFHSVFVCISTDYRSLLLTNAEGEKASPTQIMKVFQRIAKTNVKVVDTSSFIVEFPEHHLAYRALKEFSSIKKEIWGVSANLEWENNPPQLQKNERFSGVNEEARENPRVLFVKERVEEITRELCEARLLGSDQRGVGMLESKERITPDSGFSSFQASPCNLTPSLNPLQVPVPLLPTAVKAPQSAYYFPATINPLFPRAKRVYNQTLSLDNYKFSSAQCQAPEAKIQSEISEVVSSDNQTLPFDYSTLPSIYYKFQKENASSAKINGVQGYVAATGQTVQACAGLPFQYSTLASASSNTHPANINPIRETVSTGAQGLPFNSAPLGHSTPAKINGVQGYVPATGQTVQARAGLPFQYSTLASVSSNTHPANINPIRESASTGAQSLPFKLAPIGHSTPITSPEPQSESSDEEALPVEYRRPSNRSNHSNCGSRGVAAAPARRTSRPPPGFENVNISQPPKPSVAAQVEDAFLKFQPSGDDNVPFEQSKYVTAYSSSPEDEIKKLLPKYMPSNTENLRFEDSRLASVYRTSPEAEIENLLPKYMPNDNQNIRFEDSKLASAYRTAPEGESRTETSRWGVMEGFLNWVLEDDRQVQQASGPKQSPVVNHRSMDTFTRWAPDFTG